MREQAKRSIVLGHLRANLWLLVLSLVICSVLYPGAVWAVGWLVFRNAAEGSLIDKQGKPTTDAANAVGSLRIAQPFNSPVYFQPRPSAASYNGAASGGSNYGASNPKLRGRVASVLGTIARYSDAYKKAHPKADGSEPSVQDDIVAWFKEQTGAGRDLFTEWATNSPTLAQAWATGTPAIKDFIQEWADEHPDVIDAWKNDNPKATQKPGSDDLVGYFLKSYEKEHKGTWPTDESVSAWVKDHTDVVARWKAVNSDKGDPKDDDLTAFFKDDSAAHPGDWPLAQAAEWLDADQKAVVKPDAQDSDVQSTFFDAWLTEQVRAKKLDPSKDFVQVPADMVTTSGSGLDPDISWTNAKYQEDSVVAANRDAIIGAFEKAGAKASDAQKSQAEADVRKAVDRLLDLNGGLVYRPMFGLTGNEQLVNVLHINLALKDEMKKITLR